MPKVQNITKQEVKELVAVADVLAQDLHDLVHRGGGGHVDDIGPGLYLNTAITLTRLTSAANDAARLYLQKVWLQEQERELQAKYEKRVKDGDTPTKKERTRL
jgi:hypothetical protein